MELKGISFRDYAAVHIMSAAMTSAEGLGELSEGEREEMLGFVADICFEAANALLEARDKQEQKTTNPKGE